MITTKIKSKIVFQILTSLVLLISNQVQAQNVDQTSPQPQIISPASIEKEKDAIDADFQKIIEESKQTSDVNSLKDDVKIERIEVPKQDATVTIAPSKEIIPKYPRTQQESIAFYSIGILLLVINFIGSIFLPKYRYLFIGVPFDIGVREEKNEAQHVVKRKRNLIELFLLAVVISILFFACENGKFEPNEHIEREFISGALLSIFLYFGYVIIRIMWGFNSKCPKCKNMFAVKTSSWNEPKSTYNKTLGGGSNQINTYETGVTHSDHICNVCDHEWHTAKSYTKNLGKA